MVFEEIFKYASIVVLIFSLIILAISILLKNRLTTEEAWDRLVERKSLLKTGFFLTAISLSLYLIAESAELFNALSDSDMLESIHIAGEAIHMLIALGALFLLIPLFKATLGGSDA